MATYNRITLVGNLTRDPEARTIGSGSQVVKFALAINRRTKQGDETMFIDVVAWEKLGELCAQYLRKGSSVLIEGRLAIRDYTDKDGAKRKAVEVVANEMQMLDREDASNSSGTYQSSAGARGENAFSPGRSGFDDDLDSEIPF